MADYTAATAVHKTSEADTVDTITLTDNAVPLEIVNRGSAPLYGTVGFASAVPADPSVEGDDTFVVPAGFVRTITVVGASTGTDYVVKLIAASATAYSVAAGGQ